MNDLRMLLDEQNGRNNLLEKKQRKFDSESQSLQVIEAIMSSDIYVHIYTYIYSECIYLF